MRRYTPRSSFGHSGWSLSPASHSRSRPRLPNTSSRSLCWKPLLNPAVEADYQKLRRAHPDKVPLEVFNRASEEVQERLGLLGEVDGNGAAEVQSAIKRLLVRFDRELATAGREADIAAEMEHNRWTAERLARGWRFGPRDNVKRQRPLLIPWGELSEPERDQDRAFLPRVILEARTWEEPAYAYVRIR